MRFFGLLFPLSVSPLCGGLRVSGTSSPPSLDLDEVWGSPKGLAPISATIPSDPHSGLFDRKALDSWASKMSTASKAKGPKAKPDLKKRSDCEERQTPLTPPTRPLPKSPPPPRKVPPPPPPPAARFRSDKGEDGLPRPECQPRGKGSRSRQREATRSRSPLVRNPPRQPPKGEERRHKKRDEEDLPATQDYSPRQSSPRVVLAQGPQAKEVSPKSKVDVSESSSGESSSDDTRVSPHHPEDISEKPWMFRRKNWMSFVGPPIVRPTLERDFEGCSHIEPCDGGTNRDRPQKNFIAVFIPQLTRTDIYESTVKGSSGVFYVKELTPIIIDNQGPLIRDRRIPALAQQGSLLAWQITAILVHYQLGFVSKKDVMLFKADYERDGKTRDIGPEIFPRQRQLELDDEILGGGTLIAMWKDRKIQEIKDVISRFDDAKKVVNTIHLLCKPRLLL